jgi:hypoxanthine-DNA glycosylase
MIETHPFIPFIPKKAKYLLLGSFPGRIKTRVGEWYYETERGQFWKIMREVYKRDLKTVKEKVSLMTELKMALSDTICRVERTQNNNSDNNLKVLEYNTKIVEKIIKENDIKRIYFSSRFVESIFKTKFKDLINKYPGLELVTLPSSSPRYAKMSLKEKTEIFKKLLPKLS